MEYRPTRISDLMREINRELYLPAIQREFVWGPEKVERLFDSIMGDFPIGSFLFWKLEQDRKDDWPVYDFVRDFDEESPHNPPANLSGTKDIRLVLDGQQRITSLFIGLRGKYRFFHYRWRQTKLYLDLLKQPVANEENPEELTYGFSFRETADPDSGKAQVWYPIGRILDFEDAEDAKADMRPKLEGLTPEQQDSAYRLIGKLHNRIHTTLVINYYEEKSQDPEKVLQIFVRANSAGQPLEYSDLLLATATAKWEARDARDEIHTFTDVINSIGNGYTFGKDFVLKASLYLTEDLPIQYKVRNFTKANLKKIEAGWDDIKQSLTTTVRLIDRFGFSSKNIVAPLALLPIALFLKRRGNRAFDTSSDADDAASQIAIRQWLIFATLKGAFGGSSDTTLARLRDVLKKVSGRSPFPAGELYAALEIEPRLGDSEIERILSYLYQGRYTYLVLSLLYPDRDWKGAVFHEDHIFPQSEFQVSKLRKRGLPEAKIAMFMELFNTLCNLELLTDTENISKSATPFEDWLSTRDSDFRERHLIPTIAHYGFENFEEFAVARKEEIADALRSLNADYVPPAGQKSIATKPPASPADKPAGSVAGGNGGAVSTPKSAKDSHATFRETTTRLLSEDGGFEVLCSRNTEVWFIPNSWKSLLPENSTGWNHLTRPVSVACWIVRGNSAIRIILEVSRMTDPKLRLACIKALDAAGYKPATKRAFDVDASYSRFFRHREAVADTSNPEEVRAAVAKIIATTKEQCPRIEPVLREVFGAKAIG